MMKEKHRLLFLVALLALAVLMTAGNAGAIYVGDGTKQNGTTGLWDITDYGQCISGIQADGTMIVDTAHNASRSDCIDHVLGVDAAAVTAGTTVQTPGGTDYDTSAKCVATSGRGNGDIVSHYWTTNTCVDALTGLGINLSGLDRTATNCALKGGVRVTACIGSWVYTGSGAAGATTPGSGAPGFCYTTINLTAVYSSQAACPTTINGYTWTNNQCRYSYGIKGSVPAAIAKKDGSAGVAANTIVDLSALTQGQCLFNGYSWSTGITKTTTATLSDGSIVPSDGATNTVDGTRAGCLECHNSVSQYNTYAERWKEPYMYTGHKNMLRKVTPGANWAGPVEGQSGFHTYTEAAVPSGAAAGDYQLLDWGTGTATTAFWGTRPLMYIFGDWMAPAPDGLDTVVWRADLNGARYNGTSNYSCAACHATGWSGVNATTVPGTANSFNGICSISTATSASACATAGGTWYPSTGAEGASYIPAEPGASWSSYAVGNGTVSGITGKWDRDGIMCSRCHSTVFAKVGTNAAGTAFTNPANPIVPGTTVQGHNYTPNPNTANQQVTNICFGCHQSIGKVNNGTGTANDMGNPALNITVTYNAQGPEFTSHPITNQFLNSPHARYSAPPTGDSIVPNAFGKYNLVGNATTQYNSHFAGNVCRTSSTLGSGSILQTVWKNGAVTEIKNADDCNLANGQPAGTAGYWQRENQGSCTTCHNVHESLFDPNASEPLKNECTSCHNKPLGVMNHPFGGGTPLGDGSNPNHACETCHMPKSTSAGFPPHLWRINTSASYSTFPTQSDVTGNIKKNANIANEDLGSGVTYSAIWVDLDRACGQCHGGSKVLQNGINQYDLNYLSAAAKNMHNSKPTARFNAYNDDVASYKVNFDAGDTVCPSGATCTYSWNFGDSTTGSGITTSHTYAGTGPYNVVLTVSTNLFTEGTASKSVTPAYINQAPVANGTLTQAGMVVTIVDTSTDDAAFPTSAIMINWNDGTTSVGNAGSTFNHTYAAAGKYNIILTARDALGLFNSKAFSTTVQSSSTITAATSPALSGVMMILKLNGATKQVKTTNGLGVATFTGVANASGYSVQAYKWGVLFDGNAGTAGNQNPVPVAIGGTATFTHTP